LAASLSLLIFKAKSRGVILFGTKLLLATCFASHDVLSAELANPRESKILGGSQKGAASAVPD
jgi:hypothetical protein